MKSQQIIILCLVITCCLQIVSSNSGSTNSSANNDTSENNPESRGILSSLGGGIHEKLRKFVTTVKDILLGHHKRIGSFHFRLKECLDRLLGLEKKLLNLKGESYSCPDIGTLVDKVKEKVYSDDYNLNSQDVQLLGANLQNHLKYLESRLYQDSKNLNLIFDHIRYVAHTHTPHRPPTQYASIKARDKQTNKPQ